MTVEGDVTRQMGTNNDVLGKRIIICVLWLALVIPGGYQLADHRSYMEPVALGPGVTEVKKLSDWAPYIEGTVNDANVYVLDSGVPGGTAVITDAGRTGSQDSVGGAEPNLKIREYRTGIPDWSRDAWGKPCLQGLIIEMNDDGKATAIRPVSVSCTVPEEEGTDKNHD